MPLKSIVGILFSIFFLSLISLFVKVTSTTHVFLEIFFFKCFFGLLPFLVILPFKPKILYTKIIKGHLIRALMVFASTGLLFLSITLLPITVVCSISYTSPILTMLLGVLLLKEKIPKSHLVAIGTCFIGILIIINPLTNQFNYFIIVPVLQVLLVALNNVLLKRFAVTDSELTIIFYSALFNFFFALLLPIKFVIPNNFNLLLFMAIGILSSAVILLRTRAYKNTDISKLALFEYTSIAWALLYDYLLDSKNLTASTIVGVGMIVASCFYIAFLKQRKIITIQPNKKLLFKENTNVTEKI